MLTMYFYQQKLLYGMFSSVRFGVSSFVSSVSPAPSKEKTNV